MARLTGFHRQQPCSVPMQPHFGSVVWCLANTAWLGSKFFRAFSLLVMKVYNLCRV
jgi:hypothetical protein